MEQRQLCWEVLYVDPPEIGRCRDDEKEFGMNKEAAYYVFSVDV